MQKEERSKQGNTKQSKTPKAVTLQKTPSALQTMLYLTYLVSEKVRQRIHVGSLGNTVESEEMSVNSEASHGLHLVLTLQPGEGWREGGRRRWNKTWSKYTY